MTDGISTLKIMIIIIMLQMNNMNDTVFGMSRNEIFDELKALGLDCDNISSISEVKIEDYEKLKKDDIINEQMSKLKWHAVKDWTDYVLFHEKYVGNEKNGMNNINVIDLYYTVNSLPMTGDGFIYTTENIKDLILDEFLDNYIKQKYEKNPCIKIRKFKRI